MSGFKKLFKRKHRHSASSTISSSSPNTSGQPLDNGIGLFGYKNVKEKDLPKLHKSAWLGDFNKIRQTSKKVDVNQQDKEKRTALHYAAVQGHRDIVQWICTNRANVNIPDSDGRSPLMKAVETQRVDIIDVLLTHGAEANTNDVNQTTPMHLAAVNGNKEIASMLLDRDARTDPQDKDRTSPLHIAAALGDVHFVEFLLREFAVIDLADKQGRTALMAAAADGHTDVVKLLIEDGADLDKTDTDGLTAYDYAVSGDHKSVVNVFLANPVDNEGSKSRDANSNIAQLPKTSSSTGFINNVLGGPVLNIGDDSDRDDDAPTRSGMDNTWGDSDTEPDASEKHVKKPNLAAALKKINTDKEEPKTDVGAHSDVQSKRPPKLSGSLPISPTPSKSGNSLLSPDSTPRKIPNFFASSLVDKQKSQDDFLIQDSNTSITKRPPKVFGGMDMDKSDSSGWESDNGDISENVAGQSGKPVFLEQGKSINGRHTGDSKEKLQEKDIDLKGDTSKKPADDFSFLSSSENEEEHEDLSEEVPFDGNIKLNLDFESPKIPGGKNALTTSLKDSKQQVNAQEGHNEKLVENSDLDADSRRKSNNLLKQGEVGTSNMKENGLANNVMFNKASLFGDLNDVDEFSIESDQEDLFAPTRIKTEERRDEGNGMKPALNEQEKSARKKQFEDLGLDFGSTLSTVSDPEGLSETESQRGLFEEDIPHLETTLDSKVKLAKDDIELNLAGKGTDKGGHLDGTAKFQDRMIDQNSEKSNTKQADPTQKNQNDHLEGAALGFDDFDSSSSSEEDEIAKMGMPGNLTVDAEESLEHADGIDENCKDFEVENMVEKNKETDRKETWERESKEREERYAKEIQEELMKELLENESGLSEILSEDDFSLHTEDQLQEIEEDRMNNFEERSGNNEFSSLRDITEENSKMMQQQEDFIFDDNEEEISDKDLENVNEDKEVYPSEEDGSANSCYSKKIEEESGYPANNMPMDNDSGNNLNNFRKEEIQDFEFSHHDEGLSESVSFGSGTEEELKILESDLIENVGDMLPTKQSEKQFSEEVAESPLREAESNAFEMRNPGHRLPRINQEKQSLIPLPLKVKNDDERMKKELKAMIETERLRTSFDSPEGSPRKPEKVSPGGESKIPVFKGKPAQGNDARESRSREEEERLAELKQIESDLRRKQEQQINEDKRRKQLEETYQREIERKKLEADQEEKRKIEAERKRLEEENKRKEEEKKLEAIERKRREQENMWIRVEEEREAEERLWKEKEETRRKEKLRQKESEENELKEEWRKKELQLIQQEEALQRRLKQFEVSKLQEIELEKERMFASIEKDSKIKERELLERLEQEERLKRQLLQNEDLRLRKALEQERQNLEREFENREKQLRQMLSSKEEEIVSRLADIERKKEEERLLREEKIEEAVGSKRKALEAQLQEAEQLRVKEEEMLKQIINKRTEEEWKIKNLELRMEEQQQKLQKKEEELNQKAREEDERQKEKMDRLLREKEKINKKKTNDQVNEDVIEVATVVVDHTLNAAGNDISAEQHLHQAQQRGNELKSLLQATKERTTKVMKIQDINITPKQANKDIPILEDDLSDFSDAVLDGVPPSLVNGYIGTFLGSEDKLDHDLESFGTDTPIRQASPMRTNQKSSTPKDILLANKINGYRSSAFDASPINDIQIQQSTTNSLLQSLPLHTKVQNGPYVMANENKSIQDPETAGRLKDTLRETRRQLDRYKERNLAQETFKKELQEDVEELQRTVDILSKSQTDAEHVRLDMDLELRSLKYKLEQEIEARNVAEGLTQQLKDQLIRLEEKLSKEFDARQTVELAFRKQESELKTRETLIQQLEADVTDLRLALEHERESRTVQEDLYKEQLQQHKLVLHEAQRTSHDFAMTVNQLEELDKSKKTAENDINNLRLELANVKGELARVTSQYTEIKISSEQEAKRLREKLQDKTDALNTSEKTSFQLQLQLDTERSSNQSENSRLSNTIEKERGMRQQSETENSSLKNRLDLANGELEKSGRLQTNLEREIQSVKEEAQKVRSRLERENNMTKDQLEKTSIKLETTLERFESIDAETQRIHRELTEKSGLLALAQRDAEYQRNSLEQIDRKLRDEKETSHRLASQLEGANTKISSLNDELDKLHKKISTSAVEQDSKEKSIFETQEKFNNALNSLNQDLEKERAVFEVKMNGLKDKNERLMTDLQLAAETNREKDAVVRKLEQELNELTKEFSSVKVSSDILAQTKQHAETEKERIYESLTDLQKKVLDLEQEKNDLQQELKDINNQLLSTLSNSDDTKLKLATRNSDVDSLLKSKAELEKDLSSTRLENAELSGTLREERRQGELLLDELRESNKARESLESLLANIKTSNVHLEEKLQSETLSRAQREREAEEHRGLWESEIKSRSKLGMKIINMERENQSLKEQLQEEKRRTQEAYGKSKQAEAKLDVYDDKSAQHQKEVNALRNKLKQYQRKLKEYEFGESRIPQLHAEFDRERQAMATNMTNLRRQVDQQNERLRHEQEQRSRAELSVKQTQQELADLKTREKILTYEKEKFEKQNRLLEEEIPRLKIYYESNFVDKNELESYKQDIATKARLELNQKLQEVNRHLEDQAAVRETYDRIRNETDTKSKRELEETILSLKNELSAVKSTLQQGLAKQTTVESESKRLRELYEDELKVKERLSDRLAKANEKVAESNAKLNLERSRTTRISDLTTSVGRVSPAKMLSPTLINSGLSYAQPERDIKSSTPYRSGTDFKQFGGLDKDPALTPLGRPTGLSVKDYPSLSRRGYFS